MVVPGEDCAPACPASNSNAESGGGTSSEPSHTFAKHRFIEGRPGHDTDIALVASAVQRLSGSQRAADPQVLVIDLDGGGWSTSDLDPALRESLDQQPLRRMRVGH